MSVCVVVRFPFLGKFLSVARQATTVFDEVHHDLHVLLLFLRQVKADCTTDTR